MNAKEIQIMRQSLRLIATGETMEARKMLAALTMSAKPAKRASSAKCKNQPEYQGHQFGCMCSASCQRYATDWHKAVTGGKHPESWLTVNAQISSGGTLETKEEITERLSNCACGHSADHHEKDELDNLLACDAYIDAIGEKCACDHFHYSTTEQIESEAA